MTDAAPKLLALGDPNAVVCEGDVCVIPGAISETVAEPAAQAAE